MWYKEQKIKDRGAKDNDTRASFSLLRERVKRPPRAQWGLLCERAGYISSDDPGAAQHSWHSAFTIEYVGREMPCAGSAKYILIYPSLTRHARTKTIRALAFSRVILLFTLCAARCTLSLSALYCNGIPRPDARVSFSI